MIPMYRKNYELRSDSEVPLVGDQVRSDSEVPLVRDELFN